MPLKGSCHCGAVQFEVDAAPEGVTSCNCTYCFRSGALWAYYSPAQFRLTTARDRVGTYQFGTFTGEHHHCDVCGSNTHGESLDWRDWKAGDAFPTRQMVSINARMLDRDAFDLAQVPVARVDGLNGW